MKDSASLPLEPEGNNALISTKVDRQINRIKNNKFMKLLRPILGVVVLLYILFRLYQVLIVQHEYGPDTWTRLLISGLIIGSVYALIAIGYTLVYGILFMINFAHGEVMMFGAYACLYTFMGFKAIKVGDTNFLNAYPVLAIILVFIIGMLVSATLGYFLEKIAYRPLRKAPRLVPLISAIGASIFLQNAAQLLFSPQLRDVTNPDILTRGVGWTIMVNGSAVILPYTGVFTFILSILLLIGLYTLVQKSKLGRAMRATALDKNTAALMGVDVDSTISRTFIISGALAGAAGVMWGIHNGLVYYFIGFIPGIKAFTAAVLGGIGNLPGAMLGGLVLGIVESMGPAALGINFQLKDVLAFLILIIVLTFRPSGLLGEKLAEEKV